MSRGRQGALLPRRADLDWTSPPLDDVPVFWNRLMGPAWGRMLGLLNDTNIRRSQLSRPRRTSTGSGRRSCAARAPSTSTVCRARLSPIVWAIDDWNRNYKLGLVFECRVGRGRLRGQRRRPRQRLDDARPAARQLRRSLLDYMASPRFRPSGLRHARRAARSLFDTRVMKQARRRSQGRVAADEPRRERHRRRPQHLLARRVTRGRPEAPARLTVSFPQRRRVRGLVLMPRQNHREHEGDIRDYVVQASDDGRRLARGRAR